MLKLEHMSTAEKHFIRTYVAALRRDYHMLRSVMWLMHPDLLNVTDVVVATQSAVELQHMQAEFDTCLHNLPSLRKFARKVPSAAPTLDDLADLFSLSFFKVFTVLEKSNKKIPTSKKDVGWFSGQPNEWHQTFKQIDAATKASDKQKSSIFNMFSKFFPQLELFKHFHEADEKDEPPPNKWPLSFPWFGLTKNPPPEYDEYDEEDEEDEY